MISEKLFSIYSKLQDDESRGIFKSRLDFFLERNQSIIDNMIFDLIKNKRSSSGVTKSITDIKESYYPEKRIVLYGAGDESQHYKRFLLNKENLSANCLCDSDPPNGEQLVADYR